VALDLYEVAYLCGGPERVALTALVTMRQDGRIKVSPARHRVQVIHDQASHPVERAVLEAAPWPGLGLGSVLNEVAGSAAVRLTGDELRRRGLLGKHAHLSRAGRKLRDELHGELPEGLRIAVLGPAGVDDELRKALKEPDLPLGRNLVPKQRDDNKRHAYGEAPPEASVPGYPGVGGRW
jgi:hypothetical protein